MNKSNQTQFRELLRLHLDGMTVAELSEMAGKNKDATLESLKCMVDAYVDRWQLVRGKYTSVWCVMIPPENCPKPERK